MQRLTLVALTLLMAVSLACASAAGRDYQLVAKYGADVTRIGSQAQEIVIQADKSGLQPNRDLTAKAMAAFKDLGGVLNKLADGLTLYDALQPQDRAAKSVQIQSLLSEARRLTRVVMLFTGGNQALGDSLLVLFDNLDRLFTEIQAGLSPMVGAR
jgi:hypothetical protein